MRIGVGKVARQATAGMAEESWWGEGKGGARSMEHTGSGDGLQGPKGELPPLPSCALLGHYAGDRGRLWLLVSTFSRELVAATQPAW